MNNRQEPNKKKLDNIFEAVQKLTNVGSARNQLKIGDISISRLRGKYNLANYLGRLSIDDNQELFNEIGDRIRDLRAQGFDFYSRDDNGRDLLIKNNYNQSSKQLNPIQDNESEIQFLRYLRGMLLIAQSSRLVEVDGHDNACQEIRVRLEAVYGKYLKKRDAALNGANKSEQLAHGHSPQLTLDMAGEFSNILKDVFNLGDEKYAGIQLTMARDVASMQEKHFDTCTVASSPSASVATVSLTSMQTLSEDYYVRMLEGAQESAWMQSARSLQGLDPNKWCWLDYCFGEQLQAMARERNPIPPSARWLPLPATYFKEEKATLHLGDYMQADSDLSQYDEFMRVGIMIPFDVRKVPGLSEDQKYKYQKEIALDIAKEILRVQVPKQIEAFEKLYALDNDTNFPFYINYQTLLSPLVLERSFGHTDNNARFVSMMDEVFDKLRADTNFLDSLRGESRADIRVDHTNTAVNRNASITTADKYLKLRESRLKEIRAFLGKVILRSGNSSELNGELRSRKAAADALTRLLDKKMDYEGAYTKIPTYAKNIMMAALDHLVLGSQGLSIDGCKSCRDRTEIFSAAVKVMKENPEAMKSWKVLEKGIIDSLMQGHGFRAVGFHVAIVKAGLVHKKFKEGLRKDVQNAIKNFTPFSKALKEVDVEDVEELSATDARNLNLSGLFGQSNSAPTSRKSSLETEVKKERSNSSPVIGARRNSSGGGNK